MEAVFREARYKVGEIVADITGLHYVLHGVPENARIQSTILTPAMTHLTNVIRGLNT